VLYLLQLSSYDIDFRHCSKCLSFWFGCSYFCVGCKWYGYSPTVFEFDQVWKGFYPSVSDSEYPISITDPYPNAQKLHFYDVDIHYNLIRQKLTLSVSDSIFKHKYKNKYDISNIHPYPIRLHPYFCVWFFW